MNRVSLSPSVKRLTAWAFTLAAMAYIAWKVVHHEAVADWNAASLIPASPIALFIVIAMMPVNWGVEAWKWHRLMGINRPFSQSIREVLGGSALGFFTPNRSGDAVARVALLPREAREQGARAFISGAFAQMWMTLATGTFAWWVMATHLESAFLARPIIGWLLSLATAITLAAYLRWQLPLQTWGKRWPRLGLWLSANSVPTPLPLRIESLAWSGIRFAVFGGQFALALVAWGYPLDSLSIWNIPLIYLGNMLVPTAALAEMGIREALTVYFFQPNASMLWSVVQAAFTIWLINLALPAILGTWLTTKPKL